MRGEFTADDAYNTAHALRFMLPAMPFFAVCEMLSRVFFAKNQPRVPMYAALVGILVNVAATIVFIRCGIFDIKAVAVASALAQISSAIALIAFAAVRFKGLFNKNFTVKIIKIILGGAVVFFICSSASHILGCEPYTASLITTLWKAGAAALISALVYLMYAYTAQIKLTKGG